MKFQSDNETKSKIMETAFELFGRYGFEGTSIRKISEKSRVNLAAINYHFKNKENLFWEIMTATFFQVDGRIKDYAAQSKDVYELADKIFEYFNCESMALRNTMKMMMTDGLQPPSKAQREIIDQYMGPPGGQYLAQKIQEMIPYEMSREATFWGVKSVMGCVTHWSMLLCTERIAADEDPMMSPEQIRKDVRLMVEAALHFLKNRQELFAKK